MLTVKAILEEWLTSHGYDGLYSSGCGCKIGDLCPCDQSPMDCRPGVRKDVSYDCIEEDDCDHDSCDGCELAVEGVGPGGTEENESQG